MSLYPKFRDVHLWVGLILLIPMGLIALTGVFLNHEKLFVGKPEMRGDKKKMEKKEMAAMPSSEAQSTMVAKSLESLPLSLKDNPVQSHALAMEGALQAARETWGAEAALDRIELKQEGKETLIKVKVKYLSKKAEDPEEIVWSTASQQIAYTKGGAKDGFELKKFMHDLHTGAIFSKEYGFFWSDLSGIAILALGLTGVVLYVIPLMKKARKKPVAKGAPRSAAAILAAAKGATAAPKAMAMSGAEDQ